MVTALLRRWRSNNLTDTVFAVDLKQALLRRGTISLVVSATHEEVHNSWRFFKVQSRIHQLQAGSSDAIHTN